MIADASLADGRRVGLRHATAADVPAVRAFFAGLGADSTYARFFTAHPALSDRLLASLLADDAGHLAVVALPEGAAAPIVALASVALVAPDASAEIGVAVSDAWQSAGLGTLVVLVLLRDACARGLRRFHAEALGSNARMLGLLRDLATRRDTTVDRGVVRVAFTVEVSG